MRWSATGVAWLALAGVAALSLAAVFVKPLFIVVGAGFFFAFGCFVIVKRRDFRSYRLDGKPPQHVSARANCQRGVGLLILGVIIFLTGIGH